MLYLSPSGKSDHCVLQFSIICDIKLIPHNKTKTYYDRADYDDIKKIFHDMDWNSLINVGLTINNQWDNFRSVPESIVNAKVPRTYVVQNRSQKHQFPLDSNVREQIKNKLWKTYIRDKSADLLHTTQ